MKKKTELENMRGNIIREIKRRWKKNIKMKLSLEIKFEAINKLQINLYIYILNENLSNDYYYY